MSKLSKETQERLDNRLREAINTVADNLNNYHVSISTGNNKVGRIKNVSVAPGITCGNCPIKAICYDRNACNFRKTVLFARAKNTAIAYFDRDRFFTEIKNAMSDRCKRKAFRFHVGGEIIDIDYFNRMCNLARLRPEWTIWTYTHRHDIVNTFIAQGGTIPENLTILYSCDRDSVCDNPYKMPIAYTVLKGDTAPADCYKCTGNCEYCYEHKCGCPVGMSVAFDEH